MSDACITVDHVSKSYRVYHDRGVTLKERLLRTNRTSYESRLVLDDVSLSIAHGRSVGLIGRNGSGKSTLLKLLTGIIYPDAGTLSVHGRISSLLELGAGFHPDFSGRDNVYINASIFGLTRRETERRFERIVEFSELGEFIDNPVRTYSSGMYMRLAFSVAIHVDADVLFIDEILAVGDANFQRRCMDRIRELRQEGKTIVLVTHDLSSVEKICDECVWLDQGRVVDQGLPQRVLDGYRLFMENEQAAQLAGMHHAASVPPAAPEPPPSSETAAAAVAIAAAAESTAAAEAAPSPATPDDKRWGNRKATVESLVLVGEDGLERHRFSADEPVTAVIRYALHEPLDDLVFGFAVWTRDRIRCYGTNTHLDDLDVTGLPREGEVRIRMPRLGLVDNGYAVDVAIHSRTEVPYDYRLDAYEFNVYTNRKDVGVGRIEHTWHLPGKERGTR